MKRTQDEFDLRISAQWAIVPLAIAAVWLMMAKVGSIDTSQFIQNQLVGARLIALLTMLWLLLVNWTAVGQWLLIISASITVVLAHQHLDLPGTLCLLVIPVGMAVAFISVRAGAVTATAQTLLALSLLRAGLAGGDEIAMSLYAMWVTFGILGAIYYPVYQLADWSFSRYKESQCIMAEARDRRAQLEQTLLDLRRANRQLALDNQRMSALRTVADEAQRNKTAFVSRVSHEFRAPLNMIIGLTGLMVDRSDLYTEELPDDLVTDLQIIHRNSTHLAEMINDVLDLSQTEIGHLTLHRESVDFAEIVDEALQAVSPLILKKELSLECHLPSRPLTVYCDRTRIRQVLLNLLSNAARFTESGSITIEVSNVLNESVVAIHDTGPGVATNALPHIFEPFYRAPATAQNVKGSGLGLSISREIIQHHNGRIWVESEPGHGTSFYFSLPTAVPVSPITRPGHQIVPEWVWHEDSFRTDRIFQTADFSRPRIIVLDPEDTLVRELQTEMPEIELFVTHTEGESIDVTAEYSAHAILVNTHTSGAESALLLNRLRSAAPGTLVLACDVRNPLARALTAGANAYLNKPVTCDSLSTSLGILDRPVSSLLVVDDEPDAAQLMCRLIQNLDASIDVRMAHDGASALSAMRSQRPDLVLLDMVLPDDDGWAVLASIRKDPDLLEVPVFFVSGVDPSDAPPISDSFTVTLDGGIPIGRLLAVSLELSRLLLAREISFLSE